MTAASGRPGTAGASRAADPADRTAEVSWFDIREISLNRSDLAELDAREKARAAAFVFPADRHRYQVAHVMLRRVLAGHLGTDPSRLTFGRQRCPTCGGPSGKPVLAVPAWGDDPPGTPRGADGAWPASRQAPSHMPAWGDTALSGGHPQAPDGPGTPRGADGAWPGLSFSLAHSGEAVAIAVARGPVGIDVEREATGCVCSLASAMHEADAAIVEVLPEPERHLAVIRWWVRAEAVLKCAGTGIAHGMDAFPVLGAPVRSRVPPGPRLPLEPDVPGWAAAAGCSFAALSAPKGYQAALALPGLRLIRYRWGPDR
jgi:4'-phosphopantetheinyl transferase